MLKKFIKKYTHILQLVVLLSILMAITIIISNLGNHYSFLNIDKKVIMDFNKTGTVNLNGKWEFYWKKLYTYEDLKNGNKKPDIYAEVPNVWNNYRINGHKLSGYGYATYRLKVKVSDSSKMMAVRIRNMSAAYKLYIDNKLIASNGKVGINAEDTVPQYKTVTAKFTPQKDEFNIIIQVSNYSYARGGMWYPVKLGTSYDISSQNETLMMKDIFLIGALIALAIYYINFFLFRPKERINLLFVLICVIAAARLFNYGEFNIFSYEKTVFLEYFFDCLLPLLFLVIVNQMLPNNISKKKVEGLKIITMVEIIIFIVFPVHIYTSFVYIFEVVYSMCILVALVISIRAFKMKKSNSVIITAACMLVVISFINDMLFQNNVILHINDDISPIAIFISIMLESFVLSRRFADAFTKAEELSSKLSSSLKKEKEMQERLLRLDKLKDEFLANTSHELRTPLSGIISITESMIRGVNGSINEMQKKDLSTVVSSGRRLLNLVNDILDISKLKNRDIKLYKKSLDINKIISSIVNVFRYLNKNKKVKMVIEIPDNISYVMADEDRFNQIMYNLIGNAVKFTEEGYIKIYAAQENDYVKIIVEDTGDGIAKDKMSKIWDAFEQIDTSITRKHGGTGLGLYITKQLIELHGGAITAQSQIGTGSKFIFTLPVSKSISNSLEKKENTNLQFKYADKLYLPDKILQNGYSILVVDDDALNLYSIINALKLEGYNITPVSSGVKALEELKVNNDYSLVILDIMMPEMSGYEVCKRIRESKTIYDLPVLMLTANNQPKSIVSSFEAGANDFLTKPFEYNELLARVKTLVELKQAVSKALNMEMAFLQAQIKPHFLFNVLNAIAELCYINPEYASEVIVTLASYLRTSFSVTSLEDLIPIEKEIDYINTYLKLEKARFGDKLKIEYDLKISRGIMIPPLIIQPLVENAVIHGIRGRYETGMVKISAVEEEKEIVISVWDNGKGISKEKIEQLLDTKRDSKSVGLKNINMRLKRLYGKGINISSKEDIETMVKIAVPIKGEKINEGDCCR